MGLSLIGYFLGRSRIYKFIGNKGASWVLNSCCKFSVRESSRSAFSKLDIAFGVKFSAVPELFHIFRTAVHIFTPFYDNGAHSLFGQHQSGKHSRRSESGYYGTFSFLYFALGEFVLLIGRDGYIRSALSFFDVLYYFVSLGQLNINGVYVMYIVFLSCVQRFTSYHNIFYGRFFYSEFGHNGLFYISVLQFKLHSAYSYHNYSSFCPIKLQVNIVYFLI